MKIWYFTKWCGNKFIDTMKGWDHWMWAWIITCGWGPSAFLHRETNTDEFNLFLTFVAVFWGLYGIVYTGIKKAYKKFLAEQERMVEHLKDMN